MPNTFYQDTTRKKEKFPRKVYMVHRNLDIVQKIKIKAGPDMVFSALTDEQQLSSLIVDPTGITSEFYMPPRTYGLTVTKSF